MSLAALSESRPIVDNTRRPRTIADTPDTFLPSAVVRARYGGVSHMWLVRKLEKDAAFPRAIYIAGRRYWRLGDLIEWERKCAAQPPQKVRRGIAA